MEIVDDEDENAPFWFTSRFAITVLGFLGFVSMNSLRSSMNVALMCMINRTALEVGVGESALRSPLEPSSIPPDSANSTSVSGDGEMKIICQTPHYFSGNVSMSIPTFARSGRYIWSMTKQNVITGSSFCGYVISQIPCGVLAERYGGKKIFGLFTLLSSLCTLLIPLGTETHYFVVIALRFVGGIGAGAAHPSMHALLGKWAPPLERTTLTTMAYSGALFGHVITMQFGGFLCEYGFLGGWPSIFYSLGALGCVWSLVWLLLASETPNEHGRISAKEKEYILKVLAGQTATYPRQDLGLDWAKAMLSQPFLCIVASHFAFEWSLHTLEVSIPTFMKDILHVDITRNSVFFMIPYLGFWLLMLISGMWLDKLMSRGLLTTAVVRRIAQISGSVIPIIVTASIGFLECHQWIIAVSMLASGFAFCGLQYSGFHVNHLDIASRYAGILMGVGHALGLLAHVIAPLLVSLITSEHTAEQWQAAFFTSAALSTLALIYFVVVSAGTVQNWASSFTDHSDSEDSTTDEDYDDTEDKEDDGNMDNTDNPDDSTVISGNNISPSSTISTPQRTTGTTASTGPAIKTDHRNRRCASLASQESRTRRRSSSQKEHHNHVHHNQHQNQSPTHNSIATTSNKVETVANKSDSLVVTSFANENSGTKSISEQLTTQEQQRFRKTTAPPVTVVETEQKTMQKKEQDSKEKRTRIAMPEEPATSNLKSENREVSRNISAGIRVAQALQRNSIVESVV